MHHDENSLVGGTPDGKRPLYVPIKMHEFPRIGQTSSENGSPANSSLHTSSSYMHLCKLIAIFSMGDHI